MNINPRTSLLETQNSRVMVMNVLMLSAAESKYMYFKTYMRISFPLTYIASMYSKLMKEGKTRLFRPCFIDSLFPVTRPHPLQDTASEIIIKLTHYEYH